MNGGSRNGYKRKRPVGKATVTVYKRRATVPRAPRFDGQKLLVNGYCEITKALGAEEGVMSYSIAVDPKNPLITLTAGANALDGAAPPAALVADKLSLPKWNTMQQLFHQYRIDSVTVTIRVDASCGLENRLIILNDKGDSTVVGSMQSAVSGAHKEYSMTQSNRQAKYTYTCRGQERDFFSTNTNQNMSASELTHLKVFQKLPAGLTTHICEHQVTVMFNLTMKDTQNLN